MDELKVKGTMLLDHVKLIRANKKRDWSKYIEPDDWKIINGRVLDFNWYPLDLYRRLGWATFQVLGNGDVSAARSRGWERGRQLFGGVYKTMVKDGRAMNALELFVKAYKALFNFSTIEFKQVSENHARLHHDFDANDPTNVPYCHQLAGHLEALVEMAGGQNVRIELIAKQWEGAPKTVFDITWDPSP